MDIVRWQQIETLVQAALDVPYRERAAWLDAHCDGDDYLRGEVLSLLAIEDESESFLCKPAVAKAARLLTENEDGLSHTSQHIGPYKILSEIGRGGMGVVYLAERKEGEFRLSVAIKLVKRGLDTEDILRRFRNERQILASLNHPNIARLFDGGTTKDSLPYFVMEYIEGQPLLEYCDKQALSTNERLELFRTVCSAVQHAHQNLIIHRDLKPSNILVTHAGEVKLLDFGVAKFLDPELTDVQLTQSRFRVMTPEYASPEQVLGNHVTTATDIYSLGVILYELLTGARPYKLKEGSHAELARIICESEPTKPSEAVSGHWSRVIGWRSGNGHWTTNGRRYTNPNSKLQNPKLLKGDLDAIVLKALRKEPERRYVSVAELSEDVGRHLAGLPVRARVGSFSYRANRFIRRNKAAAAAASLILCTLLGGIVATTWQARKAREQARLANAKSVEAQAALLKTEKINRFMQSIFSYANPAWFGRAGGRSDVSVLEAMRDIEKHIDEDFRDELDVRADVYQQIGDSYRTQELHEDAERNLRKALQLRLELYGEDSAKVAESMFILSGVRYQQGDYAEQERLLTKALSIQRRHPDEGNNLPYMIDDYANLLKEDKNDYAGALALYREALEIFRQRYGEGHYMTGATQHNIAEACFMLGDYAQAEASTLECLKQPQPHFTFYVLSTQAGLQINKGDYQAAEDTLRQMITLAHSQDAKPDMMPNVLYTQSFMAYRHGDYAQAVADAERAFAALADDGGRYNRAYHAAPNLNKLGQAKRAETLLRDEIERLKQSERVFDLAVLKSVLGESLTAQRRYTEAETILLEAYETQKARVRPEQYDLVETRRRLAELYRAWGKADEAAKYL